MTISTLTRLASLDLSQVQEIKINNLSPALKNLRININSLDSLSEEKFPLITTLDKTDNLSQKIAAKIVKYRKAREGSTEPLFTIGKDGRFYFNNTPANIKYRKKIRKALWQAKQNPKEMINLFSPFPSIELQPNIKYHGVCYDYAADKAFKTYDIPENVSQGYWETGVEKLFYILEHYFVETSQPGEGDIIVYYTKWHEKRIHAHHYAIYLTENMFESKLGQGPVARHGPFDIPDHWGEEVAFFTLNPEKLELKHT